MRETTWWRGAKDPERKEDEVGRIQADIRIRPEVFRKNKSKKNFEKIWKIKIKILTFAPRFARNRLRRVL